MSFTLQSFIISCSFTYSFSNQVEGIPNTWKQKTITAPVNPNLMQEVTNSINTTDPLAMMPERLTNAGDKARMWLNKNNQMVIHVYITKLCENFQPGQLKNDQ